MSVAVEDFVEWVCFRKVVIDEGQKALPYICFDIPAK